jgi:hypothetical protein
MNRILLGALTAAALLAAAPATAQTTSTWWVSPFIGSNSGGDATSSSPAVGVSGGWMGSGWLGVEAEAAWTPQFFEQDGFRIDRRMRTVMGNVLVGIPAGESRLRPFVVGGVGAMSPRVVEAGNFFEVDTNQLVLDFGGGTMWWKGNTGIRGDVRYFRGMGDSDVNALGFDFSEFSFWRVSTGVMVRF